MTPGEVTVFLLSISIMLLFAKLLGEFFIIIHQPSIIGEILAGIILGPTVLGMISPEISGWLFPQQGSLSIALESITTIAVVLLLLVSGLEVDLSVVIRYRTTAVLTSIIGIIVPFVLGFVISYLSPDLMGVADEERKLVFSLFIGTAIAISSLPVIAKILIDLQIFKTKIGFIIIAAAMLNDLIGWLIFSVILGMTGAAGHGFTFTETLIYITLFLLAAFFIIRKLADKTIPLLQEKFSFPGGVLNFIMIAGFLGAAFTQFIGVHAILGAFIIGIAIGDSVHLKERTREIIQQFVTNIFAPLFFVSIGLNVNFITNFNLPVVLILLSLSLVGKVTGCGLGAWISGLSKTDSMAVGFGMSSSGAMGIIIGLLALQAGLIEDDVFVGLVVMALFTSLASAPLMKFYLSKEQEISLIKLLQPELILFPGSPGKEEILRLLSEAAAAKLKMDSEKIYSEVINRENNIPTGIANFLAVPHARLKIKKPFIAAAVLNEGLEFSSFDGFPSRIIFFLLTPEDQNELQLQILSELTGKFKEKKNAEKLLQSRNGREFIELFKQL